MKPGDDPFISMIVAELDGLARVARGLAGNAADADDLVQDTAVRALRARESFELRSFGIRPWLLRILHNVYLNKVQRRRLEPAALDGQTLDSTHAASEAPPEPTAEIDWAQFDGRILRALDRISPELRSTILLWSLESLTYREIAEVTGVPIGTVMSRLHRARKLLAAALTELADERGMNR